MPQSGRQKKKNPIIVWGGLPSLCSKPFSKNTPYSYVACFPQLIISQAAGAGLYHSRHWGDIREDVETPDKRPSLTGNTITTLCSVLTEITKLNDPPDFH